MYFYFLQVSLWFINLMSDLIPSICTRAQVISIDDNQKQKRVGKTLGIPALLYVFPLCTFLALQ